MSESQPALWAEAILGKDVEDFLAGDIGRYLIARADEEEHTALEQLATVAPWRRRRIQQLQAQVWRAQSFKSWLGELIVAGRQAVQTLETEE